MRRSPISGIYQIVMDGGRRYVGSSNDILRRWDHHRYLLRHQRHMNELLQAEWDAHGEQAFAIEMIEPVPPDRRLLLAAEQRHLDRLYATETCPLNRNPLSSSRPGGWRHTDQTRALIREKLKLAKFPPRKILRGRRWSPELRTRVRQLRSEGLSYRAIQELTGASAYIARTVCEDIELATPASRFAALLKITPEEVADLVRRANAGETLTVLARDLGVNVETVKRAFKRAGVITTAQRRHQSALRVLPEERDA